VDLLAVTVLFYLNSLGTSTFLILADHLMAKKLRMESI